MAIEKIKTVKIIEPQKKLVAGAKKVLKAQCSGEYEALRGTLVLSNNAINSFDGWSKYFINKDGSGRCLTAFGLKDYPKGTFDTTLAQAKEICGEKSKIFETEDCSYLLLDARKCVEENID